MGLQYEEVHEREDETAQSGRAMRKGEMTEKCTKNKQTMEMDVVRLAAAVSKFLTHLQEPL